MYSTCLFCNGELGRNEALPGFPVGRRLAFDASRGRLWVVCRGCERWNLTPLEERWEAIEQAEQGYRETRRRVATEQIGLARLRDGTELVRIGEPLRPEFAAWRYGDQFGRRRKRHLLMAGAWSSAIGAVAAGGMAVGFGFAFVGSLNRVTHFIVNGSPERVVARIRTENGETLAVRRRHLAETELVPGSDGPLALHLRFKGGAARFEGREALRIAATVMPHVNRFGGKRDTIDHAVGLLERDGGAEGYFERLARYAPGATEFRTRIGRRGRPRGARPGSWGRGYATGLFGLAPPDRLALEMALHEEGEMRALRGELGELERAWRDAEEIAAIADDLFVPDSVRTALERLRGRAALIAS